VGEDQFAGFTLTALLLAGMLLRHLNVTAMYALFCFGNERRLALTSIADGLAGLATMLLLVPWLGLHGAALAPLVATCCVGLPNNLGALAREEGVTIRALLAPLRSWFVKLMALTAAIGVFASTVSITGVIALVGASAAAAIAYVAVMVPLVRQPPLGPMLEGWFSGFPVVTKRLALARRTS
jgi:hypothetical protein